MVWIIGMDKTGTFIIAIAIVAFVSFWLGFFLCAVLTTSRRAHEGAEVVRLRHIQRRQQEMIRDLREQLNDGKDPLRYD